MTGSDPADTGAQDTITWKLLNDKKEEMLFKV
jgi:hypothetical protein